MAEESRVSWDFDTNVLLRIYRYCTAADAARAACVCKSWKVILYDDVFWWRHCALDFGTGGIYVRRDGRVEPVRMYAPRGEGTVSVESLDDLTFRPDIDYRRSYSFWRKYFEAFLDDLPNVRRVGDTCRRLRAWQHLNQPEVDFRYRNGAETEAWDEVWRRGVSSIKFPAALMLLYRFLDGCRKGWSASELDVGLFGTYVFDSPQRATGLHSLQDLVTQVQQMHLVPGGRTKGHPDLLIARSITKNIGIDLNDASVYCLDRTGHRMRICPQGRTVLDWLAEFVDRLESGAYETRTVPVPNPPYELPVVSLFPQTQEAGMREEITAGVRVRVSSVLMIDNSQCSRGLFFFTYSVRFYLLPVDEQLKVCGGPAKLSVQLTDRHWIIRNGAGAIHNLVNGPGVIGLYPHLTPGSEEFVYESFTESREPKTSMEGSFTFVEGTLNDPGLSFSVTCPRFDLEVPEYCY